MSTAFKQVKNNATALVATAPSPATSGLSLVVTAASGAKYPAPGNGFWATIWNATTYSDPGLDPAMEIVFCSARSTDTMTILRAQLGTSARTITTADTFAVLDVDQLWIDIYTAINALEAATNAKASWAVIAASGGDYTTLGAAYTAGARNFLVTPGTYTETTGTLNTWAATVNIFGMDRDTCIINLAAGATGVLKISGDGSQIKDITIKDGNANTTNAYDGWTNITAANVNCDNVLFLGLDSATNTGSSVALGTGAINTKFTNCEFRTPSSTASLHIKGVVGLLVDGCYFSANRSFCIGGASVTSTPAATMSNIRITNCYFNNAGAERSIKFFGINSSWPDYLLINNNNIISSGTTSPVIDCQANGSTATSIQIVTNNIINNSFATGRNHIAVSGNGSIVSNNICFKAGTGTGDPCIYLSQSVGFTISGNQVMCTAASTSGMIGIGGGTSDGHITGNVVSGFLGTNSVGIDLSYQGNARTIVTNNSISNCTTGINGSTGGNICSNNTFKSDVTTPYKVQAGSSITAQGLFLTKTTTYTATANDAVILADATTAGFTVTLPTAVGNTGKEFTVKKKDSSANAVTVATAAGNIDGSATASLAAQYNSITVKSDGANYFKVASV